MAEQPKHQEKQYPQSDDCEDQGMGLPKDMTCRCGGSLSLKPLGWTCRCGTSYGR